MLIPISLRAKSDAIYFLLFTAGALALGFVVIALSDSWFADNALWIWLGYCALLFVSYALSLTRPPRSASVQYFGALARSLLVFTSSLIVILALMWWLRPLDRSEFWLGVFLWYILPGGVGAVAFTLGFWSHMLLDRRI